MRYGAKVDSGVTSAWRNVRTAAHLKSGSKALDRPLKCAYSARRSGVVNSAGRENFKKSISFREQDPMGDFEDASRGEGSVDCLLC